MGCNVDGPFGLIWRTHAAAQLAAACVSTAHAPSLLAHLVCQQLGGEWEQAAPAHQHDTDRVGAEPSACMGRKAHPVDASVDGWSGHSTMRPFSASPRHARRSFDFLTKREYR